MRVRLDSLERKLWSKTPHHLNILSPYQSFAKVPCKIYLNGEGKESF